ncbi:hypothetical protein BSL78_28162 [Apostichopus japonicus]|uniref:Uncharacterized protein n=1 Tax=Stichopus japonicus TaxID=307972 RepID=A0A2G8JGW4_STIJA|nr:hypothetical protein BSL78_28162 [Apostichopus japonicus]
MGNFRKLFKSIPSTPGVDARMRGCADARMRGCADARMRSQNEIRDGILEGVIRVRTCTDTPHPRIRMLGRVNEWPCPVWVVAASSARVLSCLRQLDEYGGVDVLQTVKQLKLCQPLLIQSELEFCLVYELISLCTSPEMCLEEEDGGRRREEGESMYENAGHSSSSEMLDSESLYENLGFKAKSLRHSGIMQMDSNA